jgi:raffinose/stachyose/melibiose transport system substrate-binding protein
MFEEHGWKVPTSFEELQKLTAQIEEEAPDVTPVVARMNLKGYPFQYMWALGNTDFTGTPDGIEWEEDFLNGNATAVGNLESTAEYLKKWIDAGYITDYDLYGADVMGDFYDGKIAMVLGTGTASWEGTGKTTGEKIEVGIMAWPGENGNHGMLISNVASYYGLNKELSMAGNEQKLEDALKVIEFMSTEEGQQTLAQGSRNVEASPFKNFHVDEDSPLYEVKDYIEDGYTVPLVYEGWVDDLLAPMADEIIKLVEGEIDTDEMLERFDEINAEVKANPDANDFARLEEKLSKEQVARLVGMALIDYSGAEVSLVSLGGITEDGNNLENETGVQCGLYPGGIDEEIVNIFRPSSSRIVTVELTGAEINSMCDLGKVNIADPDALGTEYSYLDEAVTYTMPYVLVAKDDMEIENDITYRVAFAQGDYGDIYASEWGDKIYVLEDGSPYDAIVSWLENLPEKSFDSSALEW